MPSAVPWLRRALCRGRQLRVAVPAVPSRRLPSVLGGAVGFTAHQAAGCL
jgi:hypothetical protein